MRIALLITLIIIFIALAVALVIFGLKFRSKRDSCVVLENKAVASVPTREFGIKDLINVASDQKSSKNDLFAAAKVFCEQLSIPEKQDDKISDEAKLYLSFILLVASHSNVDAKLITYLSTESKKKNPTYAIEIETYETQGIESRKARK